MKHPLRILVADDERNMGEFLQKGLARLGHEVLAVAKTGRELVQYCRDRQPDLVITDIKMPEMDGLEAAAEIYRERAIPVIIVSAYNDPELIERAGKNHIAAYLVKPIKHEDLAPAIALAVQRFEEFESLRQETADLRQALEDRKVIERAKGLLMQKAGLAEPEAFRRLQQLARSNNRKLSEIAHMMVMAEEAFQPSKPK